MEQNTAIWVLIALALVAANAPFVSQRAFIVLPWQLTNTTSRSLGGRLLLFVVFLALVAFWLWLVHVLISSAPPVSDFSSAVSFFLRLLLITAGAVAVLALPGWRAPIEVDKPTVMRVLELLLFYLMVGAIGFAFESSLMNPFPKNWEFFVITGSLYLVLGYPGFVYRYLYRRRRRRPQ